MRLLDDPELRVVTTAEATLKKWTGEDFGVRIHYAIPQTTNGQRQPLDPTKVEIIKEGVRKRKAWWEQHQSEYSNADVESAGPSSSSTPRLAASDFALPDLSGKAVRLSELRGKIVLLNFWTTWCASCLTEIPDLIELQKRYADRLVILGVSLDGVPDSHGHAEGHREGEATKDDHDSNAHEHKHDEAQSPALKKIRAKVERLAKAKGINYRVLLDPKNQVGGRFNGGELPTNVLIDAEGRVCRRFIGARPLRVWEAMLAEISGKDLRPKLERP
ncbi:MAG: TlpA family protein disulfide reductase [Verrucomicrobia bacterium]|nr:TlpA family protein disulfide reductase [Verrucomicrobiota bacterium]